MKALVQLHDQEFLADADAVAELAAFFERAQPVRTAHNSDARRSGFKHLREADFVLAPNIEWLAEPQWETEEVADKDEVPY